MAALLARNGTSLPIRPLTSADFGALTDFHAALSPSTRSLFWPHAYDEPTLTRYALRHAQGRDRIHLLCTSAAVVGYFFLWEFDHPVPLLGLGLADAWQGQGLGAAMLQHLISEARAARRDGVELTTVTTNTRALRLYTRAGFVHIGDVENLAGDGRIVHEHRLFLALAPDARPPARDFKPPV